MRGAVEKRMIINIAEYVYVKVKTICIITIYDKIFMYNKVSIFIHIILHNIST